MLSRSDCPIIEVKHVFAVTHKFAKIVYIYVSKQYIIKKL